MAEETKIETNGQETDDTITNEAKGADYYIDAIQKLKSNSVSKEAYDKKVEENKLLVDTLISGGSIDMGQKEEKVDVNELGKKLLKEGDDMTNLDFISNSLKLRNAILDQGGEDPFLPWGQKIAPTPEDVECANRVAEAFQYCVDYADGDPEIFTTELQRITTDTAPMMSGRGRR